MLSALDNREAKYFSLFLRSSRAGHNFHCPLISQLSVDPKINGKGLIFHFEKVNLTEELLFLNFY
jgi:hypothetical protein